MASVVEVQRNYKALQRLLPDLLETSPGQCALLRHEKLIAIYRTDREARWEGAHRFPDGEFSIQPITERAIDLGWFSHVRG